MSTGADAERGGNAARIRVILAGISALILTAGIARFAYTPMLPIMCAQAGLSTWAGGLLATINYAGYMSGALLAASISDLGRKYLLYRIGLVIAVLSTLAMGLTDNLYLWSGLRYVSGLSSTAGLLLASGLALNWLIRNGHRPELGLHFIGLGLGIAVSGVAVAMMSDALAWNTQWIALGVFGLLFFVPAWFWLPPPLPLHFEGVAAVAGPAPPGRRWMWLMIASYFCAGFGFVIGATFTVAILEQMPQLAVGRNWIWVAVGLAAAPSCFLWDRIAFRIGQMQALMLAFALQILSVITPVLSRAVLPNVLAALLFGVTFVGIVNLTLTLIGRRFPANPAKAMARLTLSYGVAQILAPMMAGGFASRTGSYHGALLITAAVMIVGMLLLNQLRIDEQRGHC